MGADHSKSRNQQSTNTSVATGDIKAEDLDRMRARCMPKGLTSVHQSRAQQQADAPVAAAAPPAAPATSTAGQPPAAAMKAAAVVPMGIAAGLAAHPGALQRSSSMVRTTLLPRTDSMYRPEGGSLVVQHGNMQRTDSMVRSSGLQQDPLNQSILMQPGPMQRATSMVRTVAQQEAAIAQARAAGAAAGGAGALLMQQQQASLTTAAGSFVSLPVSFPRSSSLLRTSAQQEAAIAQNAPAVFQFGAVPAPSFPRSNSLLRTCTQQEAAIANFPRSSSLIRTCDQQQAAMNTSSQVAPASNMVRCSSLLYTPGQQQQQQQAPLNGATVPVQYAPMPDNGRDTLGRSQLQLPTTTSTTMLRMPLQQERSSAWQQLAQTTTQQRMAAVDVSQVAQVAQPSTQAPSSVPVQVLPSSQGVVHLGEQPTSQAPSTVPSAQSGYTSGNVQYIRHAPHAPRPDQVAWLQAAAQTASSPEVAPRAPSMVMPMQVAMATSPRSSIVMPRARSPEALTGFERIVAQNLVVGGKSTTVPAKLQQMRARDVYEQQKALIVEQQMQMQVQQTTKL